MIATKSSDVSSRFPDLFAVLAICETSTSTCQVVEEPRVFVRHGKRLFNSGFPEGPLFLAAYL